jgi:D-sedoheptulose 7-phosphate isomerase
VADGADALDEHVDLVGWVRESLPRLDEVAARVIDVYRADGRLFTFGNGGSSCDANHLAEELLARYKRERPPLAATSLSADASVLTCIANDYSFEEVFERQVRGLVRSGDLVVGFTTSGRSENVVRALAAAREIGATTVVFTGGEGAPASDHADHAFVVPSTSTARVQEMHVLLLHLLLEPIDVWAAGAST